MTFGIMNMNKIMLVRGDNEKPQPAEAKQEIADDSLSKAISGKSGGAPKEVSGQDFMGKLLNSPTEESRPKYSN